ncbi:hexitol phosphatase HxpB [Paraflavitalea pollutisoli]|uniref:hexitol phosphatase HxpB n=1 Tax=Paraflavitalea pollutisoli TaxID=3034143 RepID=UPI0023EBE635|nr:hexitol phosphatase HxpB [Paraflavitalea sp. H1-2-19X]
MLEAVLFDMDGLLIDSEPFWKDAEKEVFGAVGVDVTPELALQTCQMTTKEVTAFWYRHQPWPQKGLDEIELAVINRVAELIEAGGNQLPGVVAILQLISKAGYKIGLATNAPLALVPTVLRRLAIEHYFHSTSSAELEENGKPAPDVYLTAARKLQVSPAHCLVFEDSTSGVLAAKAAGMKVIAVPAKQQYDDPGFAIADLKLPSLEVFSEEHILQLWPGSNAVV